MRRAVLAVMLAVLAPIAEGQTIFSGKTGAELRANLREEFRHSSLIST
jgi:hypothetical protein